MNIKLIAFEFHELKVRREFMKRGGNCNIHASRDHNIISIDDTHQVERYLNKSMLEI